MGRGRKGVLEQSHKKQKRREQPRPSNWYAIVGGLSGKPTYVDIPNGIVEVMKWMDPQEVANSLDPLRRNVNEQIRECFQFGHPAYNRI